MPDTPFPITDAMIEAAWHEGWATGYRSGLTDGGSDSIWCDESGDWLKSKTHAALNPSPALVSENRG